LVRLLLRIGLAVATRGGSEGVEGRGTAVLEGRKVRSREEKGRPCVAT
jgi:hypothetical protein